LNLSQGLHTDTAVGCELRLSELADLLHELDRPCKVQLTGLQAPVQRLAQFAVGLFWLRQVARILSIPLGGNIDPGKIVGHAIDTGTALLQHIWLNATVFGDYSLTCPPPALPG
jgi:hypothetical protein